MTSKNIFKMLMLNTLIGFAIVVSSILIIVYMAILMCFATWFLLGGWIMAGVYFLLLLIVPIAIYLTIQEIKS